MRRFILLVILSNLFLGVNAHSVDSCLYVQLDLANRWIWRGVNYSEAPVIQPTLGYANDKLNVFIFGSCAFERRSYSEIDFSVEYQVARTLKLGFTDYFGINDSIGAKHDFLNMKRTTTMHMFDIYGIYTPSRKIPVTLLYSFWFWGADREQATLKQNFSSYLEARYDKSYGKVKASAFAGMTLGKGFYASRPAVVNLGVGLTKLLTAFNSVAIPAKLEFVLNPEIQNVYINAIISIR